MYISAYLQLFGKNSVVNIIETYIFIWWDKAIYLKWNIMQVKEKLHTSQSVSSNGFYPIDLHGKEIPTWCRTVRVGYISKFQKISFSNVLSCYPGHCWLYRRQTWDENKECSSHKISANPTLYLIENLNTCHIETLPSTQLDVLYFKYQFTHDADHFPPPYSP